VAGLLVGARVYRYPDARCSVELASTRRTQHNARAAWRRPSPQSTVQLATAHPRFLHRSQKLTALRARQPSPPCPAPPHCAPLQSQRRRRPWKCECPRCLILLNYSVRFCICLIRRAPIRPSHHSPPRGCVLFRVTSAPGKVLVAGGYLVLERPNPGLVLSTSARFYAIVRPIHDELSPGSWAWVRPSSLSPPLPTFPCQRLSCTRFRDCFVCYSVLHMLRVRDLNLPCSLSALLTDAFCHKYPMLESKIN
jgi:hypothetical protein